MSQLRSQSHTSLLQEAIRFSTYNDRSLRSFKRYALRRFSIENRAFPRLLYTRRTKHNVTHCWRELSRTEYSHLKPISVDRTKDNKVTTKVKNKDEISGDFSSSHTVQNAEISAIYHMDVQYVCHTRRNFLLTIYPFLLCPHVRTYPSPTDMLIFHTLHVAEAPSPGRSMQCDSYGSKSVPSAFDQAMADETATSAASHACSMRQD
ncbi:hypothetical protein BaRGS_00006451 [Batillaria attramentaria]|uniref:Uncharacterized protein n=1 Tax=Batillaria attramentaria TaxID=370345 RepID=A0ABD0LTJ5_9CAEN